MISSRAIEPASWTLPVISQLIAKVSNVPSVRQLTAFRTDLACVYAPFNKATRNASLLCAFQDVSTRMPVFWFPLVARFRSPYAGPASNKVCGLLNGHISANSVMDSVCEYVHFGFKFSRKLFDLTDESEPLDLRETKSPAIPEVWRGLI
jgi:hypothetical protein